MEGGDDLQLEQDDVVELVRVEPSGNLRVRMVDDPSCEGVVFPNFLRIKDSVTKGGKNLGGKYDILLFSLAL